MAIAVSTVSITEPVNEDFPLTHVISIQATGADIGRSINLVYSSTNGYYVDRDTCLVLPSSAEQHTVEAYLPDGDYTNSQYVLFTNGTCSSASMIPPNTFDTTGITIVSSGTHITLTPQSFTGLYFMVGFFIFWSVFTFMANYFKKRV